MKQVKEFTSADVDRSGSFPHIYLPEPYGDCLEHSPLWWHKRGLQKTASGYGAKIESEYKIRFNGKAYRIYHTCYGNAGTAWFKSAGERIVVS